MKHVSQPQKNNIKLNNRRHLAYVELTDGRLGCFLLPGLWFLGFWLFKLNGRKF
jgi:hypothetical protein